MRETLMVSPSPVSLQRAHLGPAMRCQWALSSLRCSLVFHDFRAGLVQSAFASTCRQILIRPTDPYYLSLAWLHPRLHNAAKISSSSYFMRFITVDGC